MAMTSCGLIKLLSTDIVKRNRAGLRVSLVPRTRNVFVLRSCLPGLQPCPPVPMLGTSLLS